MIYRRTTLKNRKLTSIWLKNAIKSGYGMKSEDVRYEIKLCPLLIMRKEKRTIMIKHIKEMFSVCFIYDV